MPAELMLNFPDPTQVSVHLLDEYADMTSAFAFVNPLTDKDMEEIRWYLEEYGTGYRAEPDDERADRVREQLPRWGTALFESVFKGDDKAYELFRNFRDEEEKGRLLTIAADHPAVLSLPWELLRSSGGVFLFGETPRISIRRRLPMAGQGRRPHKRNPKPALHLLFIVSRPEDAGFINPRTDPQAVLDALDQQEQRRVEVEFLRPATLMALEERLRDEDQPAIDIIHFDGHGVFDRNGKLGKLGKEAAKSHIPQYMKELLSEAESKGETTATPKHTGYLLFEDDQGKKALVEARILGELFHRQRIGLVVLSACQSAAMDAEDAMSSVAAWLTHAGIPGVLAMTHSVLVVTAGILFARFYRSLFRGDPVGKALDDARAALFYDPKRGERLRGFGGNQSVTLELHDWFLLALYQTGPNRSLLSREDGSEVPEPDQKHNLPKMQESGFFGRTRELWRIERAFSVQGTRRLSITGFGGQGKTYLALEAGYWLLRTGLFERVCFVSFTGFQGIDPVGVTVSTLGTVLNESLPDAESAKQALKRISTLLILDNLESLADGEGLHELLSAATRWSEAGDSRVLLTSRQPDFNHPDYPLAGSFLHQCQPLKGLGKQDALDWFGELMRLPPAPQYGLPERLALLSLFGLVGFHPLSIGLLAAQLKERRPAELGERLEALLEEQPADREDRTLLASLELSIERLPERCREWLPRLGVFQGGCLEAMIKTVTGLEKANWQELRNRLFQTGLMQAEQVADSEATFLRFHPTLAPALRQKLNKKARAALLERYWHAYYQLANALYWEDQKKPHVTRALAHCELSNLLRAVYVALQVGRAEERQEFADCVNLFLDIFGMRREHQTLVETAAKAGGTVGSKAWLSARFNLGEQLQQSDKTTEAVQVFQDILAELGDVSSYQRCLTLHRLGRCHRKQGQLAVAEQLYRQELDELGQLEQSEWVQREIGLAQSDLVNVLTAQGDLRGAKVTCQSALEIMEKLGDKRNVGVVLGQLGTLSLMQGERVKTAEQWLETLSFWQSMNEPVSEANVWHQLGIVYQRERCWEMAEQAYREAARLKEAQGLLGGMNGAANSWNQLAQVCAYRYRWAEAEQWFGKALSVYKEEKDWPNVAHTLNNLACLLVNDLDRLDEACRLAEESLTIKETLDPVAQTIWTSYNILAHIATKQGYISRAVKYRAKGRQAYFAFPGWRQQLWQHEELIADVIRAISDLAFRAKWKSYLVEEVRMGKGNLITAIRSLLNGGRDEATLCEPLGYQDAAVIRAILEGIDGQV